MAYQLAGDAGLRLINAGEQAKECENTPAENQCGLTILGGQAQDGQATLVLLDEVLMYAREKVGLDQAWRSRLVNFSQYLTQAATKVGHETWTDTMQVLVSSQVAQRRYHLILHSLDFPPDHPSVATI